jgi:hypothetical protein
VAVGGAAATGPAGGDAAVEALAANGDAQAGASPRVRVTGLSALMPLAPEV